MTDEPMNENGFEDALTPEERAMLNEAMSRETPVESTEESSLSTEEQELLDKTLEEVHQEIPVNSTTALVHETTSRFSSAIWYEEIQKQTIILAGLGGIGSYVAFLLARMKPSQLFMYDNDIVEAANMSGQLYSSRDIGQNKVNAMANMVSNYADYLDTFAINERYTSASPTGSIMICGFDNMIARDVFYRNWKKHILQLPEEERGKCLFIDGRLAAEEFQVFAIQGNDNRAMKEYELKWLFGDNEADATICSYKQTTFCANMIGSVMVNLFVNFIANQCNPLIERDIPFRTEYNAETMYFKTIS